MTITCNVGNATVKNLVKLFYDLTLNEMREAEVYTDGSDATLRAEYDTEKTVEIIRNGTSEFKGEVFEKKSTQGGGVILLCLGQEIELAETQAPVTGTTHQRVWTSTSAHTIFNDIVTEATGWSTDVTNSTDVTLDSFKTTDGMSCWNAVTKFINATNKDISIEDSTKTIYLYDNKNRTGKSAFNEGQNCGNIVYKKQKPKASKVIVFGKGDGENQIVGTSGSGTPIKRIIDRSIISTAEANNRADKELALIQNSIYHYTFNCYNPTEDVETGDTTILNAPSAGLFNESVDIVRVRRKLINDSEGLMLEITDTNHRVASGNNARLIYKIDNKLDTSQSTMQGNSVTNEWGTGINASSSQSAKVGFYIPSTFVDESGELIINYLSVDYDIDPYNQQFGDASFDGTDPQVQNTSGDEDADVANSSGSTGPTVTGTSGATTLPAVSGNTSWATNTDGKTSPYINDKARVYMYDVVIGSPDFELGRGYGVVHNGSGGTLNSDIEIETSGGFSGNEGDYSMGNGVYHSYETGSGTQSSWENEWLRVYDQNYNMTTWWGGANLVYSHTHGSHEHGDGSYAANNHTHGDGTYNAINHDHPDGSYDINAADIDNISIGDSVSEAASLNASGATVYLDYWNGSSWINKHSRTFASDTILTDIDMTNGGTYPDATGYWRIRVTPNSASPDFVNAKVRMKASIDN